MKKILCLVSVLIMVFTLISCAQGEDAGSKQKKQADSRTLAEMVSVFQEKGIDGEVEEPLFQLVGAKAGAIFYMENSVVKIYEFESEKDYQKQKAEYTILEDMPVNGKFALETNSEKAEELFSSIDLELKILAELKNREIPTVSIGEVISDDRAEVTINKIEFSYDVLPDNTNSFYTHYPAESGKVYIHVDTDVKNIQKQELNCDEVMSVKIDYDNGYKYTAFSVPEDSSTGFGYSTSIAPLTSLGVHFMAECPQEVEESQKPVKVIFLLGNDEYEYVIR
ncbi:DUF4352 domain-containing protein [Aminipila butyrica]|uniref:DUF4352 domain-containing protein n=1 Tax=Aminipila butyrica TaxID=433296 RepID=A0A858BU69_9FIRM|nr:DUF4352 domain-containing protein [Aminipila butyrica]QIB68618.1 DUF4352 domain-containing protein [Aminipila butyrica]